LRESDSGSLEAPGVLGAVRRTLSAGQPYPPDARDLATFDLAGLRLPVRATMAISVMVLVVIFDFSRTFIPDELIQYDRNPGMQRLQAWDRLILFLLVPLLVVILGFRDRPSRYGLRVGEWRLGLALALAGCAVMTPIVLWFARLPDVQAYYAPSWSDPVDVLLTNSMDLISAEFLFRGFLMMTLVRAIGPIGVLVATVPFALTHLTKPELELISTLIGGMLYGWLAWRTRSIVWGTIAHVYILTLLMAAAAGALALP
jgi:membrane protease YdiL (CAAX protease family)